MSLEVARAVRLVREEQERGRLMAQRPYASFDTWEWWQLALSGQQVMGSDDLPIHADKPHTGYYRTKRKGVMLPVAIWKAPHGDGEWVGLIDGEQVNDRAVKNAWSWCCTRPISQAEYDGYIATGQWSDTDEAVKPPVPEVQTTVAPPPIGHNAPESEADILKDQIATAKEGVSRYATIADDVTAGKAQSLRARLLELAREADKKREALKRPHFEAGKAVDLEWQPVIKDAKGAADLIARALSQFATERARAAEAERRKAEEERLRAEAAGKPAPPPYEAPAPAPSIIKGGYGRAAKETVIKVITGVTDWGALTSWAFAQYPLETEQFLRDLAQRTLNRGHTVPGVTIEEQRKVA
jgi:hypothetical protein